MIKISGVSKAFGNIVALKSISLVFPTGKTSVLIGPSGCGKSTLLRLMVGLIQPDSGSIEIEGKQLSSKILQNMRQKMGYVIQEGGLFPHLTAFKNITLMANYLGWSHEGIKNRLNELLELTHFPEDRLGNFPAELSGGQRQRVGLMRALMLNPHVLLFDEPLAALDPLIRSELQEDLKKIFLTLKKTVVMVTHDMGEATFFGDRIVLINKGQTIQTGSLKDLLNSPAEDFVTKFINAQRSPLENSFRSLK